MTKNLFFVLFVLLTCSASATAPAKSTGALMREQQLSQVAKFTNVTFFWTWHGQWRGYAEPPRLSELVQRISDSHSIFWPKAQLFQLDAPELESIEALRLEVAESLRLLTIAHADQPQLAAQLMQLRTQMLGWLLGKPMPTPLEPGLVFSQVKFDPQLPKGRFILAANPRPKTVQVVALGGEFALQYQSLLPAYRYLDSIRVHVSHIPDELVILAPNAKRSVVPIALWNRTEQPLDLTALVWLPIPAALLTTETQELNQHMVQLLQYRVML